MRICPVGMDEAYRELHGRGMGNVLAKAADSRKKADETPFGPSVLFPYFLQRSSPHSPKGHQLLASEHWQPQQLKSWGRGILVRGNVLPLKGRGLPALPSHSGSTPLHLALTVKTISQRSSSTREWPPSLGYNKWTKDYLVKHQIPSTALSGLQRLALAWWEGLLPHA